ncbi:pyrroline-5-carboxylate reductase [Burkholderia anthina]|uniref:pyrroline-5-carboxylate reductase n=1 Tax=Burkholderia anthina TaxID=179879 RepID=UPI00158EE0FE|nr:pyrroline-5-carboxylate reductase [Burkholderia anthina]MBY4869283.1 pyrroline-5-carboxylate reductase [Burkholderia anthina]
MKITFIGGGNMAVALIGGLIKRGVARNDLHVIDVNEDARRRAADQFAVATSAAIDAALARYDVVVLAVKPQALKVVAQALAPHLGTQLVISIAAGVRLIDLCQWLGGYQRVVRAMPNTPALVGMGMTALAATDDVDASSKQAAEKIVGAAGAHLWLDDESDLDAVTAISGSGPAYVFYFIEALQEAAHQLGLSDKQSATLAVATFRGAAQLAVESTEPVSVLRERVTSKGGTTAAALDAFEVQHVKEAIVNGALAAAARASQIGDELGAQ